MDKRNYSEYWAAMDEDAREYLDNIIKYGEEKEDIAEQLAEQLTQVSFDDFKDSFIDTLMDMDADASTFAENFSEYLQRAILTAKVSELLDGELSEWYKQFEEAMKDGELSEEEIKNLRQGLPTSRIKESNFVITLQKLQVTARIPLTHKRHLLADSKPCRRTPARTQRTIHGYSRKSHRYSGLRFANHR